MFHLHQVIAPAALFLAAKVEEQPRKLEHVIKVAHACLNPQEPSPDVRSDVSVGLRLLLFLRDRSDFISTTTRLVGNVSAVELVIIDTVINFTEEKCMQTLLSVHGV